MKQLLIIILSLIAWLNISAQNDKKPFTGYLYNQEYDVYMRINLYDQDITVPGQEVYGQLPGFLSKTRNSFCWLIVSAKVKNNEATLTLVNDYGSEDLTASLTFDGDSIYELRQLKGSTLKVPKDTKWQKLPQSIQLRRR